MNTDGVERFKAFISYSQKDYAAAKQVQNWLEGFKVPKTIAHPEKEKRKLGKIFLDKTDLTASPELWAGLKSKIAASDFLIVICSPAAAQSVWVDREIRQFRNTGRAENILALIIGGTPNSGDIKTECFPLAFREIEPLAANLVVDGRAIALTRIAATLANTSFDALWQRERRRQRRRVAFISAMFSVVAGLAITAAIFGLLAQNNARVATAERDNALNAIAQTLTARAWEIADNGDLELALRYALAGVEISPELTPEHRSVLARIFHADADSRYLATLEGYPLPHEAPEASVLLASSSDGQLVAVADHSVNVSIYDAATGKRKLRFSPDPARYYDIRALSFVDNDQKFLVAFTYYDPENEMKSTDRVEVRAVEDGRLLESIEAAFFVVLPSSNRALLFRSRKFPYELAGSDIRELDVSTGLVTTLVAQGGMQWRSDNNLIVDPSGRWVVSFGKSGDQVTVKSQKLPADPNERVDLIREAMLADDIPTGIYDADFGPGSRKIAIAVSSAFERDSQHLDGAIIILDFDSETGGVNESSRIATPGLPTSVRLIDERTVLACWGFSDSNAGAIWDVESGVRLGQLSGFTGVPSCNGLNRESGLLAMADERGQVRVTRSLRGRLFAAGPGANPPAPVPLPIDEYTVPRSPATYRGEPPADYYWRSVDYNFYSGPAGLAKDWPVLFRTSAEGIEWVDFRASTAGLLVETQRIATGQLDPSGRRFAGLTIDGQLQVFELFTGKKLWQTDLEGQTRARAFSFDASGQLLLVEPMVLASSDPMKQPSLEAGKVFDAETGEFLDNLNFSPSHFVTELGPNGMDVAYPNENGRLAWWNRDKPDQGMTIEQQEISVAAVAVNWTREILATALDPGVDSERGEDARYYLDSLSNFGIVRLFSIPDGEEIGLIRTGLQDIESIDFLYGSRLLLVSNRNVTGVWETRQGRLLWMVRLHPETKVRPNLGAAGDIVLTGGLTAESSQDLIVWDLHRLNDPLDRLQKNACETWLGPARHVFSAAEVARDPLLRDVWQAGYEIPRSFCETDKAPAREAGTIDD